MQYKKILLPVDGSEHSLHAAKHARGLARSMDSEIILLYCYGRMNLMLSGGGREEVEKELLEKGHQVLEPYRNLLREGGVAFSEKVVEGGAREGIVATANAENADCIVMGSRGLSDMEGMVLGSVAHRVLQYAKCPVLVVR